jgi:hypothetical protein
MFLNSAGNVDYGLVRRVQSSMSLGAGTVENSWSTTGISLVRSNDMTELRLSTSAPKIPSDVIFCTPKRQIRSGSVGRVERTQNKLGIGQSRLDRIYRGFNHKGGRGSAWGNDVYCVSTPIAWAGSGPPTPQRLCQQAAQHKLQSLPLRRTTGSQYLPSGVGLAQILTTFVGTVVTETATILIIVASSPHIDTVALVKAWVDHTPNTPLISLTGVTTTTGP